MAKQIGAPDETVAALDEIRERLDMDRGPVLTEKNLKVIRSVLVSDIWGRVVALPEQLMDEAERLRGRHPKKAHALAARAIQILILTLAPIRISNLMAIRFGVNLLRPGGPHGVYVIDFPLYDVKNASTCNFPWPRTSRR